MEKKKFTRKTKITASLAAFFLLAGGGIAYAYWTTTGAGDGEAVNAASNGEIVLHAIFDDGLTPGGSTPVTYTADNAGSSSLYVGTISHVVTTDDALCLPADFTIADVVSGTTVPAAPAGESGFALVGTGTLSFADTAINQDACKSATVTLTLTSD